MHPNPLRECGVVDVRSDEPGGLERVRLAELEPVQVGPREELAHAGPGRERLEVGHPRPDSLGPVTDAEPAREVEHERVRPQPRVRLAVAAPRGVLESLERSGIVPLGLLVLAASRESLLPVEVGGARLHLASLLFALWGTLMISKTLRIPKL